MLRWVAAVARPRGEGEEEAHAVDFADRPANHESLHSGCNTGGVGAWEGCPVQDNVFEQNIDDDSVQE